MGAIVAVLAVGGIGGTRVAAATISGAVSAGAGASTFEWLVTLSAAPGESVAAIQFDLQFDPKVATTRATQPVVAGREAKAAGKQANCAEIGPGCLRVILAGLNQKTIASGEVAVAFFNVAGNRDSLPAQPVAIRNVMLAGLRGDRIPSQVAAQTPGASAGEMPSRRGERYWLPAGCLAAAAAVAGALVALKYRKTRTRRRAREPEQP